MPKKFKLPTPLVYYSLFCEKHGYVGAVVSDGKKLSVHQHRKDCKHPRNNFLVGCPAHPGTTRPTLSEVCA